MSAKRAADGEGRGGAPEVICSGCEDQACCMPEVKRHRTSDPDEAAASPPAPAAAALHGAVGSAAGGDAVQPWQALRMQYAIRRAPAPAGRGGALHPPAASPRHSPAAPHARSHLSPSAPCAPAAPRASSPAGSSAAGTPRAPAPSRPRSRLVSVASSRHDDDMQALWQHLVGYPGGAPPPPAHPPIDAALAAAQRELLAAQRAAAQQARQLAESARQLQHQETRLPLFKRQLADEQARQRGAAARLEEAQRQLHEQRAADAARLAHLRREVAAAAAAAADQLAAAARRLEAAREEEAAAAAGLAEAEAVADEWRQKHARMLCEHRPARRADGRSGGEGQFFLARIPFFQGIEAAAAGLPYRSRHPPRTQR